MNVPSDYLAKVSHGLSADQSAEDGRILMPPVLIPAFDVSRPCVPNEAAFPGGVINDSQQFGVYVDRTNQVSATVAAFYLLSGVWELEMSVVVGWNFAIGQNANAGYIYALGQDGATGTVKAWFGNGSANQVQYAEFVRKWNVKKRPDLNVVQGDVWTLFIAAPATNAVGTNNWTMWLTVNAKRFL